MNGKRKLSNSKTKSSAVPQKKRKFDRKDAFVMDLEKGAEIKWIDVPATINSINNTGALILLNGMGTGADCYQRVGREVRWKAFQLDYTILPFPRTVASADIARVMLVWDREPHSVIPIIGDILACQDNGGALTTTNESFRNMGNKDRFLILMDRRHVLPGYTNTAGQMTTVGPAVPNNDNWSQTFYEKVNGKLATRYSANGSTIASINNGALYLLILGGIATASTGWDVSYVTRCTFTDV